MFYLSVAFIAIAALFTLKPIEITFRKIMIVEHQYPHQHQHSSTNEEIQEDIDELMKDKPPTLDDLVSSLNETLHEIGGDE